ncbi:hypothetical protein [Agrococcus sp. ARC_14]|uniref:hypothetical protein n=1 Tax=Agrococcus sp. ARC_14 TaxID=2919927 RepID=UPI001F05D124|nr:hypothetical protein [Agrococcus sp. ARC_14]MCH1881895.1 hypothetical protein [Agrococcus sp. ARC_14]
MRALAEIAIDQAGFDLVGVPERIALPSDSRIGGSLLGDLQSVDADGVRTFYYLRPVRDLAVPKWIANLARASHAAPAGHVYIVAADHTPQLVDSCKQSGCGLLRLTSEGVFEIVVDYSETSPRTLEDALEVQLTRMRRDMERKIELARTDIDARYGQSATIIASMEGDAGDRYKNGFDAEYRSIDAWGDDISRRLDILGAESLVNEVSEVEALILNGPPTKSGLDR